MKHWTAFIYSNVSSAYPWLMLAVALACMFRRRAPIFFVIAAWACTSIILRVCADAVYYSLGVAASCIFYLVIIWHFAFRDNRTNV